MLEAAGLVHSEKVGRLRICAIAAGALSEAQRWIAARRLEWERRLDRLGEYPETLESDSKGDGDASKD